MTNEELRGLATKELLAYVKGEASAMCPTSQNYWKEHLEELFDGLSKLGSEAARYNEMCEDMKADMCGTDNEILYDYLNRLLKKYKEIV